MSTPMAEVTLRTGANVPAILVRTTYLALVKAAEASWLAVYELVEACRDRSHVLFTTALGEDAVRFGLATRVNPDGTLEVHDAVRAVVLAATEGFGIEMRLLRLDEVVKP